MNQNIEQALQVLKSWHLVEFFQPYDVPDSNDPTKPMPKIMAEELQRHGNKLLPWLNAECKDQLNIPHHKKVVYQLYLGVFDKGLLATLVNQKLGEAPDECTRQEWDERLDSEGTTCFAKLSLDEFGSPNFEDMSVSTLPWALSHLQKGTTDKMSYDAFADRCELLEEELNRLSSMLMPHPVDATRSTMTAELIFRLVQSLYVWADFIPNVTNNSVFSLGFYELAQRKEKFLVDQSDANAAENERVRAKKLSKASQTTNNVGDDEKEKEKEKDEDAEQIDDERLMPILNSFYLEDIERVIRRLKAGERPEPLLSYLGNISERHPDLYTQGGLKLIQQRLVPLLTPPGRWMAEPKNHLSLMQQFAVNTAFKALEQGGLLSVNGPPGTGKTTLLRDIVAQNVVARAEVLAKFSRATEGLDGDGYPIEALAGFEMVVASTNNAAVENISKELPRIDSLGEEFQQHDYMRPVASMVNAKKNRKGLLPTETEERCWGMVSAVTGRKSKRDRFKDDFFFTAHYKKETTGERNRDPRYDYLNFWQWKRVEPPVTFKESKHIFNEKRKELEAYQRDLHDYAHLFETLEGKDENGATKHEQSQEQACIQIVNREKVALEKLNSDFVLLNEEVEIETQDLAINKQQLKAWWQVLFDRNSYKELKKLVSEKEINTLNLKRKRLFVKKEFKTVEGNLSVANSNYRLAKSNLQNALDKYRLECQRLAEYKKRFAKLPLPRLGDEIESDLIQRACYFQNEALNRLRSQLFACGLNLHQSWIAEVSRNRQYVDNVLFKLSDLLQGKQVKNPKALWTALFMMVPVLSTTFASLARQFKELGTGDIGWLLIDEAGQAIPQAAVGGLWRAKRVLVVGDPLQVEPVFTTPPKLVEFLTERILGQATETWSPNEVSVQKLADRVNPYGCAIEIKNKLEWIGIPLWVHRRCIEPMFSVANEIAYESRMIHGVEDSKIQAIPHKSLGFSRWVSVAGQCSRRQFNPEHATATIELLQTVIEGEGNLEHIYIISPFRAVKEELKRSISMDVLGLAFPSQDQKKKFYLWHRNNIGTVHTFQGKENDTVILVLGCDQQNSGGAVWAASKPNILNVAITRAKKHLFVIGDRDVWAGRESFKVLAKYLDFLENKELQTEVKIGEGV
ncbi:MAG: superfamily I DNA and/or RNA helicase [Lentisphaeria bacterium]|jgi:superfamily I DNA and/or RNA helicase